MIVGIILYLPVILMAVFRARVYNFLYVRKLAKGKKPKVNVLLYLFRWRLVSILFVVPIAFLHICIGIAFMEYASTGLINILPPLMAIILFSIFPWTLFLDPRNKRARLVKKMKSLGIQVEEGKKL